MSDGPPPSAARILVVEDHAELADALALNLRHAGHVVGCVRDGYHAVLEARAWSPDLIVLDLNLPRLDGLGALARLREAGQWCPVLILSARADAADKVEGFRLGADDYVTKPFVLAELLARVGALLRRGGQGAAAAPPAPPAPPPAADPVVGYTDEELVDRFGLTRQQAVVARLLASGLSNAEIAATLGITRFTARNHARSVLDRLDLPGRGRVAALLRAAYDAERGAWNAAR